MARPQREDRQSGERTRGDFRSDFERDRDRLLYSTALRRLVGVTQVVSPAEGEVYHNRLTHTLKVAQVARRLAEMFQRKAAATVAAWGSLDPDVVEAAALAHDLGHPPFGHIAEDELNTLVSEKVGVDGYEGNAQSFRVVTRLAVRREKPAYGLDLTRATLDATLKYPWLARDGMSKYGAFRDDEEEFRWARALHDRDDELPSIEAQIMDWADDITYSLHDTEDFYRAGFIPLHLLRFSPTERGRFLAAAVAALKRKKKLDSLPSPDELGHIFDDFCAHLPTTTPYSGTRSQRGALAEFTSRTVADYVKGTKLKRPKAGEKGLEIDPNFLAQVALLKELTWFYVIDNPTLAAHQYGQRKVIRTLYEIFSDAATHKDWVLFPAEFREEAEDVVKVQGHIPPARCARLVSDTIASMTDQQALRYYHRLTGHSQGSVLDPIVG